MRFFEMLGVVFLGFAAFLAVVIPVVFAGVIFLVNKIFGLGVDFGTLLTVGMWFFSAVICFKEGGWKGVAFTLGLAVLAGGAPWVLSSMTITPSIGVFVSSWVVTTIGLCLGVFALAAEQEVTKEEMRHFQ